MDMYAHSQNLARPRFNTSPLQSSRKGNVKLTITITITITGLALNVRRPYKAAAVLASPCDGAKDKPTSHNMSVTYRTPSPPPVSPITPAIQELGRLTPRTMNLEQTKPDMDINSPNFNDIIVKAVDPSHEENMAEPRTPVAKRTRTLWHGLLSPNTPSSNHPDVADTDAANKPAQSENNEVEENPFDLSGGSPVELNTQLTLNDTNEFAEILVSSEDGTEPNDEHSQQDPALSSSPELIETPTRSRIYTRRGRGSSPEPIVLRRSTRIAEKPTIKDHSKQVSLPSKKETKTPTTTTPTFTWATPYLSPYDVSLTQNEDPVPHSTDWQLQYPPGGSTHPSYPWPRPDPRLVFHAHFVPLADNLPDISRIPKLSLPIGWRQVSWSGLLPVVFDPYRQAFKLTPVGPIPLTSEELHQSGLYRYTPGGELHPESAILPDISQFTDGSVADVYNFEGVDWVLPWCAFQGATGVENAAADEYLEISPRISQSMEKMLSPASSHYIEACDCPDDVFDLEDAWRWMSEKEEKPGSPFAKSPGKSWIGSGILMTSRKQKKPIPHLLAVAMSTAEAGQTIYLGKQNKRDFCPFKSVATPPTVDITLLKDIEFTLIELLSYFPQHSAWKQASARLASTDLTATEIANLITMTRALPDAAALKPATLYNHMFYEKQPDGTRSRVARPKPLLQPHTAESWTYDAATMDYPLLGLAHGLRGLPSGPDAGPLTELIAWCRAQGRYIVMLSEVPRLLEEAGITPLIDVGDGEPDREVMARYVEAVREDRVRLKEGKAEGGVERGVKRKKTV